MFTENKESLTMAIIAQENPVVKYLYSTFEKLTSVPLKHISNIIISSASKGFTGKMSDIEEYSPNHRTTIGYFLNKGKRDSDSVSEKLSSDVYNYTYQNEPILFMSLDDTVNEKHKASESTKKPMEEVRSVYSHLKGGFVYGHQVFAAMAGNLCYKHDFCRKDDGGKIEKAVSVAQSLPILDKVGYVLTDKYGTKFRLYTCKKIIDAFSAKNYHAIGALKTNRVIRHERSSCNEPMVGQYSNITVRQNAEPIGLSPRYSEIRQLLGLPLHRQTQRHQASCRFAHLP
jgi:hypothetical protein